MHIGVAFSRRVDARRLRTLALAASVLVLAGCGGGGGSGGSSGGGGGVVTPPVTPALTSYQWKPVAVGGGGFIISYSADPTGATRLIKTDVYGAYIWNASKDRWVQLVTTASMPADARTAETLNKGVYDVTVAPSKPSRIFLATNGHVYRSDDSGATFTNTGFAPVTWDANSDFRFRGPFLSVSPTNPDLVLIGTPADGLWRSSDAGATWTKVSSVPASTDLRPWDGLQTAGISVFFEKGSDGAPTGAIWAMSPGNGMYRSTDNGATFTHLAAGGPTSLQQGTFAPDGSFYAANPEDSSLWKFKAGAWTDLTHASGLGGTHVAIGVDPADGTVYTVNDGGDMYRSTNGGATWATLSHSAAAGPNDPPWLSTANVSYFATGHIDFDPVKAHRMWLSAGMGIFYADVSTSATSVVYTSQTRGVEELVANDIIAPQGKSPLFGGWDFGLRVKDNLDTYDTDFGPVHRVLIAVQQMDWSPANPSFIVTNASDTRVGCCTDDGNSVAAGYSSDGGKTWTKFATLPTPPGTSSTDPWRMSFGTIAVSATDTNNIVWEPSMGKAPFYTKDKGATWHQVHFTGETGDFTGSHYGYYLNRKTVAADRVNAGTFYLYHSGDDVNNTGVNAPLAGLWATTDGGATWTKRFNGEITPFSVFNAKLRAVPGQAGNLFFTTGGLDGIDSPLKRSTDGGTTWTTVTGATRVLDIGFGKAATGSTYPTIFFAGKYNGTYGIWRSTDNAATFKEIGQFPVGSLDEVKAIEGDKDTFGKVYIGYQGSGWAYGQPSSCTPSAYIFADNQECDSVP